MGLGGGGENGGDVRLLPTALASSVSALLARIPLHPLDTIKSQQQASLNAISVRTLWRQSSLASLYRGMTITALGSVPAGALYFTAYEYSKLSMSTSWMGSGPVAHFLSGMIAECVSCLLWLPIDVVKERRQVHPTAFKSDMAALREISSRSGILALYRGYGATILSFGPFSAIYFMSYEELKRKAGCHVGHPLPMHWTVVCAATAGAIASAVTAPLDKSKLRIQVQTTASGAAFNYRHVGAGLQSIWAAEGFRGLFSGVTARVAFHVPSTALTMTLYEVLRVQFHRVL